MKFFKRHAYALLFTLFSDGGKCLLSLKRSLSFPQRSQQFRPIRLAQPQHHRRHLPVLVR